MKKNYKRLIAVIISITLIFIIALAIDMNVSNFSSSAARDLEKELISYLESDEYTDNLIYSVIYDKNEIKIFEKMNFMVKYIGYEKYSLFKNNRINKYSCWATITRYVKIDDSDYIYNTTYKNISYLGYDDNDLNSVYRAYINPESKKVEFSESEFYYNDYSKQVSDAYNLFLESCQ